MNSLVETAQRLDQEDSLAKFRAQFSLPRTADGSQSLYLAGHSLGLMPLAAPALVQQELEDWARLGVQGHHAAQRDWIGYAEQLRPSLARLAGARELEVVAMNSLSVNLHLMMASFYRPVGLRRCIVIEAGAFPSDRHAVTSQIHWHGLDPRETLIELTPAADATDSDEAQLEALLEARGAEIALVLWPGVQYLSGRAFDLARIAAAARRAGARSGFDLAHAIGNLPLALHDADADFAALAGAFVHSRHSRADLPGLAGWWGHDPATRFQMGPEFIPAQGAAGWQISNPPILSAAPLLASLPMFDVAGMQALRSKSLQMTALLIAALDQDFRGRVQILTPREDEQRGNQLSMRLSAGRDAGRRIFEALSRLGVVADWREPDVLRVGFAPLYNSFADVARFIQSLARALETA
jgi:kynureninase